MSEAALEAELTLDVGGFAVHAELRLQEGVLVFFGPSGAGKSLTLRAIAGLVRPKAGFIRVRGETLFDSARGVDVPSHLRRIGYVPQHHSLLPFRDVSANVAFGLPRAERKGDSAEVRALLEELGLAHLAHAMPPRLSGGERQRVALARALAVRPRLLLLDEPFASLDLEGRRRLREVVKETLRRHETPAAFVTHDPEEALTVGTQVVRFERGRTTETGVPALLLSAHAPLELSLGAEAVLRVREDGECELVIGGLKLTGPREHLEALQREGRLSLRRAGEARDEVTQDPSPDLAARGR